MKFAALALGLLATAFVVAVDHYFGKAWQPLLPLGSGSGNGLSGPSVLHLLAGAGLVGTLLVVPSPLPGGLLLLATACGWFLLGASSPVGFSVIILVPLSLCLLGSLLSVGAAGRSTARAKVKKVPRLVDIESRQSLEELEREAALSRDLSDHFGRSFVPEVASVAPVGDPARTTAFRPPSSDGTERQTPSLVLVLMIANLVLSAFVALAVLLLYLSR